MNKSIGILLTLYLLISMAASAAQVRWKGKIVKEGEATIVLNIQEPIYREPILILKEDFALGGGKAQGEAALASARGIAVDNDGDIYVGDIRQSCIKVYSQTGAYIRTIGRRGQGPGELSMVDSIVISQDNQELIVGDIGKLVVFDLQGRFKRNIATKGFLSSGFVDGLGNVCLRTDDLREKHAIYRIFSPDLATVLADIASPPAP